MDIDLKSAGIGAGAGACLVGLFWLGKKLFTKKVVTESTPKWDQMKNMFDIFNQSTKDNASNNAKLMDEIMDSNMPASLIEAVGKEVGIKFTSQCRKDMIKIIFMIGDDGVAAIKSQYEKWKNKEFASEKKEENSSSSESQTEETKE